MNGLFPYWLESIAILCCFKTANEIASLAPSVVSHWSQSVASVPGGEPMRLLLCRLGRFSLVTICCLYPRRGE